MNIEAQQETNKQIYPFGFSNDKLIKKIFGSYLLASIVSSIVAAIGPIVDGIVTGQILGAEADYRDRCPDRSQADQYHRPRYRFELSSHGAGRQCGGLCPQCAEQRESIAERSHTGRCRDVYDPCRRILW